MVGLPLAVRPETVQPSGDATFEVVQDCMVVSWTVAAAASGDILALLAMRDSAPIWQQQRDVRQWDVGAVSR